MLALPIPEMRNPPSYDDKNVILASCWRTTALPTLVSAEMRSVLVCTLTVGLLGCAVQRYTPVPVTAAQTAAKLETRTLRDDGFRQFLEASLGHAMPWPPKTCDFRFLTLAAFYFNPDLAVARAQLETANAAVQTARMRPNPVLDLSFGIPNPYLLGLGFAFPIITSGKRTYSIERAKNLSSQAELALAELAWKVRGQGRSALLNYRFDVHNAAIARATEQLQAGDIARPEWDAARAALLEAQMASRAAEGRLSPSRAALATAIGVPVTALEGLKFEWSHLEDLPPPNLL